VTSTNFVLLVDAGVDTDRQLSLEDNEVGCDKDGSKEIRAAIGGRTRVID
jgi:hypothetical protein